MWSQMASHKSTIVLKIRSEHDLGNTKYQLSLVCWNMPIFYFLISAWISIGKIMSLSWSQVISKKIPGFLAFGAQCPYNVIWISDPIVRFTLAAVTSYFFWMRGHLTWPGDGLVLKFWRQLPKQEGIIYAAYWTTGYCWFLVVWNKTLIWC